MRFFLCLAVSTGFAAGLQNHPVVEVYLPPVSGSNIDQVFIRARQIVGDVYSEIGFRVVWRAAGSHPPGCKTEPLHQKIVVAVLAATPREIVEWAFAYSNPYATDGPCVKLLMDRLRPAIHRSPLTAGYLLGNVLAHEMGHVLQGVLRHSETGVMKARWSAREISSMPNERPHFTAEDVDLMLRKLGSETSARTRGPG